MKRLYVVFIALLLLMTSCSFKGDVAVVDSKEFVRTRMEQIIEAINTKDAKTIKEMFSANIIKQSPNLDKDIQTMFNTFQGKIETYDWDVNVATTKRQTGFNIRIEHASWFTIITDSERYIFHIEVYQIDTFDQDNIGLDCLFIVKESDEHTKLSDAIKAEVTGFYAPI